MVKSTSTFAVTVIAFIGLMWPFTSLGQQTEVLPTTIQSALSVQNDELIRLGCQKSDEYEAKSCGSYYNGCCEEPWYSCYAQAEVLFWTRDNRGRSQALVEHDNNQPVITTDDLDFDYQPNMRINVGIVRGPCHCCYAWEFGYLGIFDASASAVAFSGANDLHAVGDMGLGIVNGFVNADSMRADYSSDLHSFEANCVKCCYRCCWTDCCKGCGKGDKGSCGHGYVTRRRELDTLCGFRYIAADEDFSLISDNIPTQVNSRYDVRTTNDLYGFQLGARLREYRNRLGLEVLGKVGIYGNDASQSQILVDQLPSNPVTFRDTSASGGDVAFLGELGVSLLYDLTPALTLRAGYNLLWLEGVALAPDQLDLTMTGRSGRFIDDNGGVLYHGASLGIEFRH
jgi:hypothetical protein